MARVRIELPEEFSFTTKIPIRITDLNYGGHVGNDKILSLLHEARVQYLTSANYGELDVEGVGLIMSDVAIEYRAELFYNDELFASVKATEFSKLGFDLYYLLEKIQEGKKVVVVKAKTGMICYDYTLKKIAPLPEAVRSKLV